MGPPVNRRPDRDEAQPHEVDEESEDEIDETDSPVRPRSVRQRTYRERVFHRDVSTVDEVMQEATGYVSSFIADRLDEDGFQVPDYLRESSQNVKRYFSLTTYIFKETCHIPNLICYSSFNMNNNSYDIK